MKKVYFTLFLLYPKIYPYNTYINKIFVRKSHEFEFLFAASYTTIN